MESKSNLAHSMDIVDMAPQLSWDIRQPNDIISSGDGDKECKMLFFILYICQSIKRLWEGIENFPEVQFCKCFFLHASFSSTDWLDWIVY